MAEHLDYLLTVHHFLNEALGCGYRALHGNKVLRAIRSDLLCNKHHSHARAGDDECHPHAEVEHIEYKENDYKSGLEEVGKSRGDELADRLDVVGVMRHYVSVRVRVEVAQGEGLHLIEHLLSHTVHKALSYHSHNSGVREGCDPTDRVDAEHKKYCCQYLAADGAVSLLKSFSDKENELIHKDARDG